MALTDELHDWASALPLWQQHLVASLVGKAELGAGELDAAYALLVAEHGVDIKCPEPRAATADLFVDPSATASPRLISLGQLRGVNAVAEGQRLEFEPRGLTVVYGDNGAGKTGYVRPLKHAGRAVARDGEVLPNVFAELPARCTAKVELEENGAVRGFELDLRAPAPADLASLSVLDARCADNYVTEANTVAFTPKPLLIFDRLVRAQQVLRERLETHLAELSATAPSFPELAASTKASRAVEELRGGSDRAELRALANLTDDEQRRMSDLREAVATAEAGHSGARAAGFDRQARLAEQLGADIGKLASVVGDDASTRLAELEAGAKTAAEAARLAREQAFAGEPVPGVGSEAWRALWETARHYYAHELEPGRSFPPGEHGERCPLCLQELDETALMRMRRFEDFVQSTTSAAAAAAEAALSDARAALSEEVISRCRPEFLAELSESDTPLAKRVEAFVGAGERRFRHMIRGEPLTSDGTLPEDPRVGLSDHAERCRTRAAELRGLKEQERLNQLRKELSELDARARLGERLEEPLRWITTLGEIDKLRRARAALATHGITRRQRELAEKAITESLRDALKAELDGLRLSDVRVDLAARGQRGSTVVRLQLGEGAAAHALPAVLSDGEQRALALAFFLAELRAAGHDGGIVLDDPVSSLDQERREQVAERLCREAGRRQVIIFSHDLPLLVHLDRIAAREGVPFRVQRIWRTGSSIGLTSAEAPWPMLSARKRLGILTDQLQNLPKPEDLGPERYRWEVRQWYEGVRETWERAVEMDLFNGVIERYGRDVKTGNLRPIAVTEKRVLQIERGMTRCSSFVHDESPADAVSLPDRAEMARDLEELRTFLKEIKSERKVIEAAR